MSGLTKAQHFLMAWLDQADRSAYGECRGHDLDTLVNRGLATVADDCKVNDWSAVALTAAGRAALREQEGR
jgi:hypothetical protein